MEVLFSDTGQWTARLVGEVDADNCKELESRLSDAERVGDLLVLDISQLTFIDSSGISTLLRHKQALETDGSSLQLRGPTDSVRRVLEITGLLETFGISDS